MSASLLALEDRRFIGIKPEPAHAFKDRVDGGLRRSFVIGVLDAQQKGALVAPGKQVVEKCRTCSTNVKHSGRGGGKSRNRHNSSDEAPLTGHSVDVDLHQHVDASLCNSRPVADATIRSWIASITWGGDWALVLALGSCAGAAVYMLLGFEPSTWLIAAILATCVATYLGGRALGTGRIGRVVATGLLGIGLGLAAGKIATLRAGPLASGLPDHPVWIEGWVSEIEEGRSGPRLRLLVHAIAGEQQDSAVAQVRLTHTSRLEVSPGRFVRCWSVLKPPPAPIMAGDYAFDRQAYYEGLDAVGYVQGRCRGGTLGRPADWADAAVLSLASERRMLAQHVRSSAGERAGGFAAALVTGDRSMMEAGDIEALRASGLAHLLAISGLHLGIVGGIVFFLLSKALALIEWLALRVPVQKFAAGGAITATTVYLILSGASISTQRAYIMAVVFFAALIFDRSPLSFRSFAIAMLIVVALHPQSVLSPGFQMSFAATGALIATYEAWRKRRMANLQRAPKGWNIAFTVQSLALTAVVGALATAPFALFHFQRIAATGIVANLMAMPIITFLSAPLAAAAMVATPFGLADPFLRLFGWSLELVLAIAHWNSGLGGQGIVVSKQIPGLALAVMCFSLAIAMTVEGWRTRLLAGASGICIAVVVWQVSARPVLHWSPSGDVFAYDRNDGWQRYRFAKGDGLNPLSFADVDVTEDCRETNCDIGKVALRHSVLPEGGCETGSTVRLVMADDGDGRGSVCPALPAVQSVSWHDVSQAGGRTWIEHRGVLKERPAPKCGNRPWQVCQFDRR